MKLVPVRVTLVPPLASPEPGVTAPADGGKLASTAAVPQSQPAVVPLLLAANSPASQTLVPSKGSGAAPE